jgi:hypothetical protein
MGIRPIAAFGAKPRITVTFKGRGHVRRQDSGMQSSAQSRQIDWTNICKTPCRWFVVRYARRDQIKDRLAIDRTQQRKEARQDIDAFGRLLPSQ